MNCECSKLDTKMKCIIFIVFLSCQLSSCVIYRLNDTEYFKMPKIYHLDDYDACLHEVNGTYCYVEMNLVSDIPSNLLQMIHEYSEHTITHFNHTKLHYGICLTKTCKHFIQQNKVMEPGVTLERCLNESLWKEYKLKTELSKLVSCQKLDDPVVISTGDTAAAVFFLCLALLNIIGTLYDFCFVKGSIGYRLLLSFSFKRNMEKLVTFENEDKLRDRFRGIHGLRVLSIMFVIFAHSPLPLIINTDNPHGFEKTYDNILFHILYNGTLIVQTFFIMTSCLMAFNIRRYFEKNEASLFLIPKGIMMRWLRVTPAYAVLLIFTLTWIRFIASGPLWEVVVGVEVADCNRFWWWNIIYLNNYIDNNQCMAQTWYLAADMQLFILGLFVSILAKTSKLRNIVLSTLFAVGLVIPAIHTYMQDLHAVVLITPEAARNIFLSDPTFNNSYKRGHTNIPSMVLGLALGNLIYEGLNDDKIKNKYKKLGYLYYLTVPMGFALILSCTVYYADRPRLSIYIRTVLSAFIRPIFALLIAIFFIGMVFKFENVYRRVVEWRGWRVPARVSYSAYLLHVAVIRVFAGMNTTLSRMGLAQCLKEAFGITVITLLLAYPFWLFVEAPLNEAILIMFGLSKKEKNNDSQKIENVRRRTEQETTVAVDSNRPLEINIRL